jgi:hypothetical protein
VNRPADYEACGDCQFDHAYERDAASRWHAQDTIYVASKHVDKGWPMQTSAVVCLDDALNLFNACDYDNAAWRALTSLAYSVGTLSPVYQRAKAKLGL